MVASAAPLERIESRDETSSQLHSATCSVLRHGNDVDNSASIDDGDDVEESRSSILFMPPKIQIMQFDEIPI